MFTFIRAEQNRSKSFDRKPPDRCGRELLSHYDKISAFCIQVRVSINADKVAARLELSSPSPEGWQQRPIRNGKPIGFPISCRPVSEGRQSVAGGRQTRGRTPFLLWRGLRWFEGLPPCLQGHLLFPLLFVVFLSGKGACFV